jgi:hypothetical protein
MKHSRRGRKSRKSMKKTSRRRKQRGGNPSALNLLQGQQYRATHMNQYGGGASLVGAPLGDSGMLPDDLRMAARITPLDAANSEISGMRDEGVAAPMTQSGGRRKSRTKKSRKSSKKARKSTKKSRKPSKKVRKSKGSRRQRGGALEGAPYNGPSMLISPSMAARAGTADFSNPLLK